MSYNDDHNDMERGWQGRHLHQLKEPEPRRSPLVVAVRWCIYFAVAAIAVRFLFRVVLPWL